MKVILPDGTTCDGWTPGTLIAKGNATPFDPHTVPGVKFEPEPDDLPLLETLRVRLTRPVSPLLWRIQGWQPRDSRILLAAQFKAGKTTLVTNAMRSLVDGDLWLGREVVTPVSSLVLIDCEMGERQGDAWLRAQRIRRDDCIRLLNLRGRLASFDIVDADKRARWAAHLRQYAAEYLILDCARPMLDALGLDEHRQAGTFLTAFDALLAEAGIRDALVVHHMGHLHERARGDSRFRDWPDAEWRLVRKNDDPTSPRYISAFGRDVDVSESQLLYDVSTRRLTIASGSRQDGLIQQALDAVLTVLKGAEAALSGRAIKARLEDSGIARDAIDTALKCGVETGALHMQKGLRQAKLYRPAPPRGRVSRVSGECPADSEAECPAASIKPDTQTLDSDTAPVGNGRTLAVQTREPCPVCRRESCEDHLPPEM